MRPSEQSVSQYASLYSTYLHFRISNVNVFVFFHFCHVVTEKCHYYITPISEEEEENKDVILLIFQYSTVLQQNTVRPDCQPNQTDAIVNE